MPKIASELMAALLGLAVVLLGGRAEAAGSGSLAGTTACPPIERVSVAPDGSAGNGDSVLGNPANSPETPTGISADGRFVAFSSKATNLVNVDTKGVQNVFVSARNAHEMELVSVDEAGQPGTASSAASSISADGRYVLFVTGAILTPEQSNSPSTCFGYPGRCGDLLLRNRVTNTTEAVLVSDGYTVPAGGSISGDGRFVTVNAAFGHPGAGVALIDRQTHETTFIAGQGIPAGSSVISSDGRFVVFVQKIFLTQAPYEILGIDLYEVATGQTTTVARGNSDSDLPSISAHGRYVAFESDASDLVPGDTNGQRDVFVRDLARGTIERVSVASDGTQANGPSSYPSISATGRYVAFSSNATNLTGTSASGAFLHDRVSGATVVVAPSGPAVLSGSARVVAFGGTFAGLLPDDPPGILQVYARASIRPGRRCSR